MIPAELTGILAQRLDTAQTSRRDTPSLADSHELDIDDAYAVQAALLELRVGRGERVVGVKLGFTSKAKMAQMGVSDVIVGRLTDAMRIADGDEVDLSRFIHPKVEPEVAFRLCRDVDPKDPSTDIESCVDAVAPAVEIIDSRYRDFRFTYTDVVADNTSAAGYAIGPWRPWRTSPTVRCGCVPRRRRRWDRPPPFSATRCTRCTPCWTCAVAAAFR